MVIDGDQKKISTVKPNKNTDTEPLFLFGFTVNPSHSSAVTLLAINN